MSTHALVALVRKDLKIFLSDPWAVVLTFIVPIVLASFMGMIFDQAENSKTKGKLSVLVIDRDSSPLTKKIIESMRQSEELEVRIENTDDPHSLIRSRKAVVAVVFPKNFGELAGDAMFGGQKKPELELLYDPSRSMELAMVRGMLTQHVMQTVSADVFSGQGSIDRLKKAMAFVDSEAEMAGDDKKTLRTMFDSIMKWQERVIVDKKDGAAKDADKFAIGGFTMPYETREEAVTARQGSQYNSYGHSFAGMAVQFILFAAIEMGVGLLTERKQGLWKRLRAAPLSRATLLAGKTVSGSLISLMTIVVVFLFGMAVFGIRIEGSAIGFLLVALSFSLVAATLGLLIAAVGNTPEASRGISIFVVLIMLMLGGAWMPAFIFPQWLQGFSLAMPTRWAVDGFDDMLWRGLGLHSALLTSGVLLGFAILFGVIAVAKFRWQAD